MVAGLYHVLYFNGFAFYRACGANHEDVLFRASVLPAIAELSLVVICNGVSSFSTYAIVSNGRVAIRSGSATGANAGHCRSSVFTSFSTTLPRFTGAYGIHVVSSFCFRAYLYARFLHGVSRSPTRVSAPIGGTVAPREAQGASSRALCVALASTFLHRFIVGHLYGVQRCYLSIVTNVYLSFPFIGGLSTYLGGSRFCNNSSRICTGSVFLRFLVPP